MLASLKENSALSNTALQTDIFKTNKSVSIYLFTHVYCEEFPVIAVLVPDQQVDILVVSEMS